MKKKITLIDYGAGNIRSIERALNKLGFSTIITNNKKEILESASLILPGVGAFGKAMEKLQELELVDVINKYCKSGKPVLGICLGMQLFCSRSYEFGDFKGLNLIPGTVKNISSIEQFKNKIKVPVIGWHEVKNSKKNSITVDLKNNFFYHIHSFYCDLAEKKYELFETIISGIPVCTGLNKDNIYGFQFHPEKSRGQGIELLNQFCNTS